MLACKVKRDLNQADNPLDLAFGEITVSALQALINSSLSHTWPPGLSLPTSDLGCDDGSCGAGGDS